MEDISKRQRHEIDFRALTETSFGVLESMSQLRVVKLRH
jgi:hypothetical protein